MSQVSILRAITVEFKVSDTHGNSYFLAKRCGDKATRFEREYSRNVEDDAAHCAAVMRERAGWSSPMYGGLIAAGKYAFVLTQGEAV